MRVFIVLLLTIILSIGGYVAYQKYLNPNIVNKEVVNEVKVFTSTKSEIDLNLELIRSVPKQEKSIESLNYFGWIPDWDMADGLTTLEKNPQIKSASPFWFEVKSDGSLLTNYYTNWQTFINFTAQNGVELIPTVTSFERDKLTSVLNSPENTNKLIDEIMQNVLGYNYAGIDLDIEHIFANDEKLYFDFVSRLSGQLKQNGKKLHCSPLAKWGDYLSYGQTRFVLDYSRLNADCDIIKIQGYGYSIVQDPIGPVGPVKWLEDVIRYAIKEGIPREKIVIGIHNYAMDWSIKGNINYNLNYREKEFLNGYSGGDGVAYYNNGVEKLLANYVVTQEYIEDWGEVLGTYDFGGQPRAAVFMNNKSIEVRKKLAADYGINGISYWRLGDEAGLKL